MDGAIGVIFVDILRQSGMFTAAEAQETIEIGALNGLFVLGRSLGFIGNFFQTHLLLLRAFFFYGEDLYCCFAIEFFKILLTPHTYLLFMMKCIECNIRLFLSHSIPQMTVWFSFVVGHFYFLCLVLFQVITLISGA